MADLAARLRPGFDGPASLPRKTAVLETPHIETFKIIDFETLQLRPVQAELRHVSPSAYFYAERGTSIPLPAFERSAQELEEVILPAIRRFILPDFDPGAGVDSRLTILHADIRGVAGYATSLDLLPEAVYPFSNERPVVYMSLLSAPPGSERYYGTLAHEVQHIAHFQADPFEQVWVHEGSAELLADLAGYPSGFIGQFFAHPDTQLNGWRSGLAGSGPHYGAAHMFFRYLAARYGDERMTQLVASREVGLRGVEAFLRNVGTGEDLFDVFVDWTIANYQASDSGSGSAYPAVSDSFRLVPKPVGRGEHSGTVAQFGTDYLRVTSSLPLRVTFQGTTSSRLIPAQPPSGRRFWWSNQGDQVDSTLTLPVDLTGLTVATLRFKLWFDIEEHFDHAYVEASADGGTTWEILEGLHTTTMNPLGQSFGHAYTGTSGGSAGPRWVEESVDLTPFAGKEVLLRFEYVTDEGVNHHGLAIDDVAIAELDFFDDAEDPGNWSSEGFVRTDNSVPQRFAVSLIPDGEAADAVAMVLDSSNRGSIAVPAGEPAVLVISALGEVTAVRAEYQLTVEASQS